MTLDLDRYPVEMRRLRRATTALLIPGVAVGAFGVLWLVLVGMIIAFHEEMKADAGEDYWMLLGLFTALGVIPSLVAAVLIRMGWVRRRLRLQLRELAALVRLHGVPGDAALEQQLGLTTAQRARLLAAAVERGLLPARQPDDPAAAGPPPPGAVFNDTYVVEAVLRQNVQGAVYRVRHTRTEQRCALETFVPGPGRSAAQLDATLRASLAASELDHPGLVRVVDLDTTAAGLPYAVTEWLDGPHAADPADREAVAAALEALRGAGLELIGAPDERVYVASEPGGGRRPVLLHVGHLRG